MKIFYESLHPEAQEELIRNGVIELVTAWVDAVPDPDRRTTGLCSHSPRKSPMTPGGDPVDRDEAEPHPGKRREARRGPVGSGAGRSACRSQHGAQGAGRTESREDQGPARGILLRSPAHGDHRSCDQECDAENSGLVPLLDRGDGRRWEDDRGLR